MHGAAAPGAGGREATSRTTPDREPRRSPAARDAFPIVSDRERTASPVMLPHDTDVDLELLLRRVIREESGITPVSRNSVGVELPGCSTRMVPPRGGRRSSWHVIPLPRWLGGPPGRLRGILAERVQRRRVANRLAYIFENTNTQHDDSPYSPVAGYRAQDRS